MIYNVEVKASATILVNGFSNDDAEHKVERAVRRALELAGFTVDHCAADAFESEPVPAESVVSDDDLAHADVHWWHR